MKKYFILILLMISSAGWGCYYDYPVPPGTSCYGIYTYEVKSCVQWSGTENQDITVFGCNVHQSYDAYGRGACYYYGTGWNINSLLKCPTGTRPPSDQIVNKPIVQNPELSCGSIINVDNKFVIESVPLTDIPFSLVYSSERVKGNLQWNQILTVGNTSNPTGGITNSYSLYINDVHRPLYDQTYSTTDINFEWDNKDEFGNDLFGVVKAEVHIKNHYSSIPPNNPGIFPHVKTHYLGRLVDPGFSLFGLGGWGPDILHHYDEKRETIYLGDGSSFKAPKNPITSGGFYIPSRDRSLIFIFDSNNRHTQTKKLLTKSILYSFTYNLAGSISSIEDAYGNATTFQYTSGKLSSITSPHSHVTNIVLDSNDYISAITNPNSQSYEMTYTSSGLLLTFEKPAGLVSTMVYNSDGTLISDSNTDGNSVSLSSARLGNGRRITETSATGTVKTHTYSFDSVFDYLRTSAYPSGETRGIKENFDGSKLTITDGVNEAVVENYASSPWVGQGVTRILNRKVVFGATNNTSFTETPAGNTIGDPFSFTSITSTSVSDSKTTTQLYTSSTKTMLTTSPLGRMRTETFNNEGDILSISEASLVPLSYDYNSEGKLTKVSQGSTREISFSYDPLTGFLSSVENALGQVTSFVRDSLGRVTTQVLPDLREIDYSYDGEGNITSTTPPSKPQHSMTYNGKGNLTNYYPPVLINPISTSYSYNDDSKLLQVTRPNGQMINYGYQTGTGNLTSIIHPGGLRSISYTSGLLMYLSSEDGISLQNAYTSVRRLFRTTFNGGAYSGYVSNGFNTQLLIANEGLTVYSYVGTVNFGYDNDNLLISAGSEVFQRSTDEGFLTKITNGSVVQDYSYSSDYGELASHEVKFGSTDLYSETLARNDLGRVVSKTRTYGGGASDNLSYTFDSTGRLSETYLNSSLVSSYSYDSNSNRISQTLGTTTTAATYDDQDRLLTFGTKSFTYNDNGELISETDSATSSTKTYTYNVFGALKGVVLPTKTITYKVDSYDRRVAKLVGGSVENFFVWNLQNQIVGITSPTGPLIARFIYGSKSHVPDYMEVGANKYQIITDHLGSPVVVVNTATGVVAQEVKYDEFGNIISDTNPGFTPFGFAGCLYDQDTKLCRFGARDYDASTGRWLSKDPILFGGGDTNLYGYVMQDPINFIDPSGLKGIGPILDIPDYLDPNTGSMAGAFIGTGLGLATCGPFCGFAGGIVGSNIGGMISPNSGLLNVGGDTKAGPIKTFPPLPAPIGGPYIDPAKTPTQPNTCSAGR